MSLAIVSTSGIATGDFIHYVRSIKYRYKKRCTNCQDHKEMKRLLKQNQEQAKPQFTRNKGSGTVSSAYKDLYREIL